jgi:hypothetical protein
VDRFDKSHPVGAVNVGNRIAAFVDLRAGHSDEEHESFSAVLATLTRWTGRGPHRTYPNEAQRFYFRLLDVLNVVAAAYSTSVESE